jgi:hypothetical protein
MREYEDSKPSAGTQRDRDKPSHGVVEWIKTCKGGKPGLGNFLEAEALSETINLAAVSLRVGKKVLYDAANMKITNIPEANKYLTREYRKGWEL